MARVVFEGPYLGIIDVYMETTRIARIEREGPCWIVIYGPRFGLNRSFKSAIAARVWIRKNALGIPVTAEAKAILREQRQTRLVDALRALVENERAAMCQIDRIGVYECVYCSNRGDYSPNIAHRDGCPVAVGRALLAEMEEG